MKCPKCGSENIIRYEKGVNIDTCEDCETIIQFYQTRLDKVLSKFEPHILANSILVKRLMVAMEIQYGDCIKGKEKGFYLFATYNGLGGASDFRQISLDTVESLLNDLEVE